MRIPKGIRRFGLLALISITLGIGILFAQTAGGRLEAGFQNPPESARPRVWWHWMNANITKEGIQADMEWMKRVGIGGVQNFDGNLGVPRIVEKPLIYMSPEWKDAFRFAVQTADKLGLEVAVAASPGWSETGGPWVEPREAMKKYVWTETWIEGGRPFTGKLAQPSKVAGPFQNEPAAERSGKLPEFYSDARVFAYRVSDIVHNQVELDPLVTASALQAQAVSVPQGKTAAASDQSKPVGPEEVSSGAGAPLDPAKLSDGDVANPVFLAETSNENPTWVRFEYRQPTTITGLTIAAGGSFSCCVTVDRGPVLRVEASDDGQRYRVVSESVYNGVQRTMTIPATTARFFRIVLFPGNPEPLPEYLLNIRKAAPTMPGRIQGTELPFTPEPFLFGRGLAKPKGIPLSELALRTIGTVDRFEVKSNFWVANDYYAIPTPSVGNGAPVAKSDVIDLTSKMSPDGSLDWTPPNGRWVIIRLGYSLAGHQNGPASAEATGLEVDKLNKAYVSHYMDTYLDMFTSAAGSDLIGSRGLTHLLNDSYEAGFQNWTDNILEEFKARRGYDASPYLPTLVGTVVESPETSDKFLWDFRRTIYELLAQDHYGVVSQKAHERGLRTYGEALEDRRAYQGDDMEMRQFTDVPMAAMWSFPPGGEPRATYIVDDRGAASVAHVYGQKYVAAESFTGADHSTSPKNIKHVADVELIFGINRFVVHQSVHQPISYGPGLGLGDIGQFFNRNEAWAEQAKP
jgi:hypothetical protein